MNLKDLFGLEGKNAVITGSGSGMGYAATKALKELGVNVYATVRRKPLDFTVTKEIKTDLGNPVSIDATIEELPREIEALFICHGISNAVGYANALEVNLTNFFSFKYLTEKLLPRISDNGSVTFISSNGGRQWRKSIPECLEVINCRTWEEAEDWYNAHPDITKGGYVFAKKCQHVYVMSKVRSPEFRDRKIRLNAIAPGYTLTGLSDDFNKSVNGDAEYGKRVLEHMFLSSWNGRAALPEEMGYPLVVAGSKICGYMSGQIIYIDYGGSSALDFDELRGES
jgi:NAD(P)-dependent dehydrogenase (short-subunit alcohol dehydrogenase family)